jgi:hypothetical protein
MVPNRSSLLAYSDFNHELESHRCEKKQFEKYHQRKKGVSRRRDLIGSNISVKIAGENLKKNFTNLKQLVQLVFGGNNHNFLHGCICILCFKIFILNHFFILGYIE